MLSDFFKPRNNENENFNAVKISIASPERIRSWSSGEVKRPDTVNYRTIKPESGGLFCARIFGPVKDYECVCGKYKKKKYRGTICEKCGVELTTSKLRRERMGHIELATPVAHIWFLKSLPSRICTILDLPLKTIEKVLYYDSYIVSKSGKTPLYYGQLLSEEEYLKAMEIHGEKSFNAGIGAEVIRYMLSNVDLEESRKNLRYFLPQIKSETIRKKLRRRLKLIEDFISSDNKVEWMILDVIPVIPPDLRPLVMLDEGNFATSDLNELYRRVINRNNRLRRLLDLNAPSIIIRNEKRMLQEGVDALFDNNRKSKIITSSNKKPLKSLSDMLKGKYGRFRQNLLGKRVDYSGRSVIVVGPELKLHQCGIPKKMALELMRPFIYSKLESYGMSMNIKLAKQMVDDEKPEIWDILEEVLYEHPILLNRAPTLHKLGFQAFDPILVEGKSIQLHPLVCSAFNADFDGDQMAVHIPLSIESQLEARILMMSTSNVLSSSNGEPVILPTQDIIIGIYYLSFSLNKETCMIFNNTFEIEHALEAGYISIHSKIKFLYEFKDIYNITKKQIITSTPGRILISDILPKENNLTLHLVNKLMNKKEVSKLFNLIYKKCGQTKTTTFADNIMKLGFNCACQSGISISKNDLVIPKNKYKYVKNSIEKVKDYNNQYTNGFITSEERYNKSIEEWTNCSDKISFDLSKIISKKNKTNEDEIFFHNLNSIFIMNDSGARGSLAQMKQLSGMKGLMSKPSGEIIENPIISNFKEGLNELEYFISTHGARKGLIDTALKTANAGYLTRKLVDVAQDSIVVEKDCNTDKGINIITNINSSDIVISLKESVFGRYLAADIFSIKKKIIALKGDLIDDKLLLMIENYHIESLKVRSVLMCQSEIGVCVKCYGQDLSSGKPVNLGEAVGIIAAQSIGEPGTQLTMRTFHVGGVVQKTNVKSNILSPCSGTIKFNNLKIIKNIIGNHINVSRNCTMTIKDINNMVFKYKIPYGSTLCNDKLSFMKIGQEIAKWDPFLNPIITEVSGYIDFIDIEEEISLKEKHDDLTGIVQRIIVYKKKNKLKPTIVIKDDKGSYMKFKNGNIAKYYMPENAILNVYEKQRVNAGDVIAKILRNSSTSKDITGGLPRVIELFEARVPKEAAVLSKTDGYIKYGGDYRGKKIISIENNNSIEHYFIPRGKLINFNESDYVLKGEMIVEGEYSPHDVLEIMGIEKFANFIINEIQKVYKLQGIIINNKHIEIILRQMLKKFQVTDPGDTSLILGDYVDIEQLKKIKSNCNLKKYIKPSTKLILQGITKASLTTTSFLSAASFQETVKILTEASIASKIDFLKGLKENVLVGKLIPSGTGFGINNKKI